MFSKKKILRILIYFFSIYNSSGAGFFFTWWSIEGYVVGTGRGRFKKPGSGTGLGTESRPGTEQTGTGIEQVETGA